MVKINLGCPNLKSINLDDMSESYLEQCIFHSKIVLEVQVLTANID
jgi:hypothetical protein